MSSLDRFKVAQNGSYGSYFQAISEIRFGGKVSHWIWYVFPQLSREFRGQSENGRYYGLKGFEEAVEYFNDPLLGSRLIEISEALMSLDCSDPNIVMGWEVDAKKLRSCMTLFSEVAAEVNPDVTVFDRVLEKYFNSRRCEWTTKLLNVRKQFK